MPHRSCMCCFTCARFLQWPFLKAALSPLWRELGAVRCRDSTGRFREQTLPGMPQNFIQQPCGRAFAFVGSVVQMSCAARLTPLGAAVHCMSSLAVVLLHTSVEMQ